MYNNRVYSPEPLRAKVLDQFHEGHPGITAMKTMVRSLIWYPGLDKAVEERVKSCHEYLQARKKPSQKTHTEWGKTERPFSRIHIDHFDFENKTFLLVIDSLTKYIECEVAKSTSASEIIELLTLIFSRHGLPDTIVSDNAPGFKSEELKSFYTANHIHLMNPPPYSPASNGQAERSVETIKKLLKKNTNGSMRVRLANVLLYYRNAPHSITGMAPSVALNGRKYVTVKDRINPCYVPKIKDHLPAIPNYSVNDKVYALNLREGDKWLLSTVVEKLGQNVYNVRVDELNTIWKRHCKQLLSCSAQQSIVSSANRQPITNTPISFSQIQNILSHDTQSHNLPLIPSSVSDRLESSNS